jgi:methylthioribose-1-phosphate isomerase
MLPIHIGLTPDGALRILDQTLLPGEERYLVLTTVDEVAEAISVLRVRGAPLIGVAAAYGVTLATRDGKADPDRVLAACDQLEATRPTAVNLPWAMARMRAAAHDAVRGGRPLAAALRAEADAIWAEDRAMCEAIGAAGAPLLPSGATVMTICNAGSLATGGRGTALAPVYLAHEHHQNVSVVACETRPLLQGSRLTAWELSRAGVPVTVITDGMAASRLRRGGVTCVIVGADRIALNGDTANKIGTYAVALAARAHGVPFYVAAPRSTYDPATADGASIPIEERRPDEVRRVGGATLAAPAAAIWNPAFDVTPAELVTGYITDAGLLTAAELPRRLAS